MRASQRTGDLERAMLAMLSQQGHQELPAKAHQLVVAETRQRAAYPDVEKQEAEDLGDKPEHGQHGLHNDAPQPAGSAWPKGLVQPPKKSSVATQPTVIMLAYSAIKNMANFMELYSVW